jgi:phosphatidylinositol alpha-1,6-mannosyltransferase
MKKTLIISLEYPPQVGGIATYVHQFASALPSDNVVLLAPFFEGSQKWDEAQTYTIIRKSFFFPKAVWPRWLLLYFHVRKIIKEHNIEQLHVHHMLPVGYVAYILRKKVPYLVFSHGTDMVLATKSKWKRHWTQKVLLRSKRVFTNSDSLRLRFVEQVPLVSDIVDVVYPCPDREFLTSPDPETLASIKSSLALEGKQVLLTVARLDDGKGIPQLIRTIAQIVPAHPNLVWVLIGDGKKRSLVIELIQKYRLQNVVRFLGSVPHYELNAYYHIADVFALLTHPDGEREEGLGLVFLEAAAAGLPIVAGKSGGVEEAVLHTQTGLVVNTYHQDEVAGAIARLLQDKAFAAHLGTAAQSRILSEFSWENQLTRIAQYL